MQRLENPLIIDPAFKPERLQPASLELTLADEILVDIPGEPMQVGKISEDGLLYPGCFVLASTIETVHIPNNLVAQVDGKSSYARRGLVVHQTAGFIDPGFRGQITLEFSNASLNPIRLWVGMPICQLVFFQMSSPAERPYGTKGLGSHYMGQEGPTPARV
jgi:dCTP deaminase